MEQKNKAENGKKEIYQTNFLDRPCSRWHCGRISGRIVFAVKSSGPTLAIRPQIDISPSSRYNKNETIKILVILERNFVG